MAGISPVMLSAYSRAAANVRTLRPKCKGMRWSVIAGIGKIESNHAAGRNIAANGNISPRILDVRLNGSGAGGNTSSFSDTDHGRIDGDTAYDRAVGPMQFLPSTWNGPSGQDGNNDGVKDPHNAFDPALGTAVYFCGTRATDLSRTSQLREAVYRYNRSEAYVDDVTGHIAEYDRLPATGNSTGTATGGPAPSSTQHWHSEAPPTSGAAAAPQAPPRAATTAPTSCSTPSTKAQASPPVIFFAVLQRGRWPPGPA